MKKILILFLSFLFFSFIFAQKITPNDLKILKKKEDSLKIISLQIIQGRIDADRFKADSQFTKMFVRALKIQNSFHYRFDSLLTISKLSPPDSSFKIFTWQMVINDNVVRQHGAIQMRTNDGSLKLIPLIDKSDVTKNMADTIGNNFGWMGAVYYKIIQKKSFDKTYYTLLGYDENSLSSNKKFIEVLTFKDGEPIFGGSYFSFPDNSLAKKGMNRLILEYKKNASPRLTYDAEEDMIVYEHLISESGEPQKKYTYIGDGDYEALKWKDGKWVHIDKLFTQKLLNGQAPVPEPLRDEKGNINDVKLKDNVPETQDTTTGDDTQPIKEKIKTTPTKTKIKKK